MFGIEFAKLIGLVVRHVATAVGAILISKGLDHDLVEVVVGGVVAAGALVASAIEKRD